MLTVTDLNYDLYQSELVCVGFLGYTTLQGQKAHHTPSGLSFRS